MRVQQFILLRGTTTDRKPLVFLAGLEPTIHSGYYGVFQVNLQKIGYEGFEPPASCSQSKRASQTALIPVII